jgi:predicted Rossmann fold flavoprotein
MLKLLQSLGHQIVPCVPSLFTFNIKEFSLKELAGVSVERARLKLLGLEQAGPLLITHWGFSGPAVLKLSAFGARALFDKNYKADLLIDWQPDLSFEEKQKRLSDAKELHAKKQIGNASPFSLPQSLWRALLEHSGIDQAIRYADLSKAKGAALIERLHRMHFEIEGQTTYKEEFVTAGGVALNEVNFKNMESRRIPGVHFAGEVLDIDGVTGGFNFQNAWTTSWIAGSALK